MTLVLKLLIELVGFLTILITLNPMGQPVYLKEAWLIERFANHQTSVKRLNHPLKLRYNDIKLSLL